MFIKYKFFTLTRHLTALSACLLVSSGLLAQNFTAYNSQNVTRSSSSSYHGIIEDLPKDKKPGSKHGIFLHVADTFKVDAIKYWRQAYGYSSGRQEITALYALDEDLMVDDQWISSHDHYSVWDSKKVNPYDFNPVKFKGSDEISLGQETNHWISPLPTDTAVINSKFGMRRYRWHYGVDLDLERGDEVVAVDDGIVRVAQYDRYGYGHYVVLRHKNGLETLYGHFLKRNVRVGQEVKKGDVIGLGGSTGRSTGYHLHFEVRYKGAAVNPSNIYNFAENKIIDQLVVINTETFQYAVELSKKRYHRIRPGDTLGHISMRYNTSVSRLCRLNGISRNKVLRVGRTLRVR